MQFDKEAKGPHIHRDRLSKLLFQGAVLMSPPVNPTAAIIVIGDEILSGRTKDKNIGWLAEQLNQLGIQLVEARIIADNRQVIIDTVRYMSARYDRSLQAAALALHMTISLPKQSQQRLMLKSSVTLRQSGV